MPAAKPGRKALNLTEEEMIVHRKEMRKKRLTAKKNKERQTAILLYAAKMGELFLMTALEEKESTYADLGTAFSENVRRFLEDNPDWFVSYQPKTEEAPEATGLAGYNGERLKRPYGAHEDSL